MIHNPEKTKSAISLNWLLFPYQLYSRLSQSQCIPSVNLQMVAISSCESLRRPSFSSRVWTIQALASSQKYTHSTLEIIYLTSKCSCWCKTTIQQNQDLPWYGQSYQDSRLEFLTRCQSGQVQTMIYIGRQIQVQYFNVL